ncbi:hypothetical protein [Sphingomonas sp. LH128]|uniref:hypothetical protein n=1 Tax=Sphingomonas sp. LH128 TaxID=473781 RepID=UPI00155EC76D|nr:hypothetical protein [Sphingomonas sp. LH128]
MSSPPPTRHATRAARSSEPIGARPILWRGWLAGLTISLLLWALIAALVVGF